MDVTAPVMVAVGKLTMFAYNFRDGKNLDGKLLPAWREVALTHTPTPLEFASYMFYFASLLTGPPFEMKPYLSYINGDLFRHPVHNKEGHIPPGYALPTLNAVAQSVVSLLGIVVLTAKFPLDSLLDMAPDSPMQNWPVHYLFGYAYIALVGKRCTYYFIWKLAEGCGNLAGIGFNGYKADGAAIWDRFSNVVISKIEYPPSLRDITTYWNAKTSDWLKNYVYFRQAEDPAGRPPKYALYLTNAMSAFWHGFYPGYYISFVYAAWCIDIYRALREYFRPMVVIREGKTEIPIMPQKFIYDTIGTFLSILVFAFGMLPFVACSLEFSWNAWKRLYFLGIVFAAVFQVFVWALPKKRVPREEKKKE